MKARSSAPMLRELHAARAGDVRARAVERRRRERRRLGAPWQLRRQARGCRLPLPECQGRTLMRGRAGGHSSGGLARAPLQLVLPGRGLRHRRSPSLQRPPRKQALHPGALAAARCRGSASLGAFSPGAVRLGSMQLPALQGRGCMHNGSPGDRHFQPRQAGRSWPELPFSLFVRTPDHFWGGPLDLGMSSSPSRSPAEVGGSSALSAKALFACSSIRTPSDQRRMCCRCSALTAATAAAACRRRLQPGRRVAHPPSRAPAHGGCKIQQARRTCRL